MESARSTIRGMCCDSCITESNPPTIAQSETCGQPLSHARSHTARKMSAARGHSKPSSAFSILFVSSTPPQPFRLSPGLSPLSLHRPEQRLLANQLHRDLQLLHTPGSVARLL